MQRVPLDFVSGVHIACPKVYRSIRIHVMIWALSRHPKPWYILIQVTPAKPMDHSFTSSDERSSSCTSFWGAQGFGVLAPLSCKDLSKCFGSMPGRDS